jgi:hypothetical protein
MRGHGIKSLGFVNLSVRSEIKRRPFFSCKLEEFPSLTISSFLAYHGEISTFYSLQQKFIISEIYSFIVKFLC